MNGYVTLRDKGTWNYCIELRPGRGLLVGVSHNELLLLTTWAAAQWAVLPQYLFLARRGGLLHGLKRPSGNFNS